MKKWLCMVLCIGMMFGAVGCGDAEQTTEPEEKQEEQVKKEDTRGIAGSHYYDMCNAMMKNGFPQFETSYLADEDINIGISLKKGNAELKEAIDSVLSKMTKDDFSAMMDEAISVQPLAN